MIYLTTLLVSDRLSNQRCVIRWWWIMNMGERKTLWPNWNMVLEFASSDWENLGKTSVKFFGASAEIELGISRIQVRSFTGWTTFDINSSKFNLSCWRGSRLLSIQTTQTVEAEQGHRFTYPREQDAQYYGTFFNEVHVNGLDLHSWHLPTKKFMHLLLSAYMLNNLPQGTYCSCFHSLENIRWMRKSTYI